jgi:hypothetical protein
MTTAADIAGGHQVSGRGATGANAIASLIRHIVGRSCAALSQENAACQLA